MPTDPVLVSVPELFTIPALASTRMPMPMPEMRPELLTVPCTRTMPTLPLSKSVPETSRVPQDRKRLGRSSHI